MTCIFLLLRSHFSGAYIWNELTMEYFVVKKTILSFSSASHMGLCWQSHFLFGLLVFFLLLSELWACLQGLGLTLQFDGHQLPTHMPSAGHRALVMVHRTWPPLPCFSTLTHDVPAAWRALIHLIHLRSSFTTFQKSSGSHLQCASFPATSRQC